MVQRESYLTGSGYRFPAQISVGALLALTTLLGVTFASLRFFRASAAVDVLVVLLVFFVCVAQMRFGNWQRFVSTGVGAVLVPVWALVVAFLQSTTINLSGTDAITQLPFLVFFGGVLGYCTGTLAAGMYLLFDVCSGHRPARIL